MSDEEIRNIALRLKNEIGVSFTAQAEAVSMDISAYCKIVNGRRAVPEKHRQKISQYLESFKRFLDDDRE